MLSGSGGGGSLIIIRESWISPSISVSKEEEMEVSRAARGHRVKRLVYLGPPSPNLNGPPHCSLFLFSLSQKRLVITFLAKIIRGAEISSRYGLSKQPLGMPRIYYPRRVCPRN